MDENKELAGGVTPKDTLNENSANAEEVQKQPDSDISGDISDPADNSAPVSEGDGEEVISSPDDADETDGADKGEYPAEEADPLNGDQSGAFSDAPQGLETVAKRSGFIPKSAIIIAVICLCAAVIAAAVLYQANRAKNYNPYNDMGYYNISGRTIGEVATGYDMSLEEFLEEYELPTDMRADTYEIAAYNMMPVSRVARMYGLNFDTMKQYFGFADTVTEDTPYGEAYDTVKLKYIFGEDIDAVKEKYALDESVSGETTWGEVRRIIDKKDYEDYMKSQAEAATETVSSDSEQSSLPA